MIGKWGFSLLPFYLGIIPIFANNNYTLTQNDYPVPIILHRSSCGTVILQDHQPAGLRSSCCKKDSPQPENNPHDTAENEPQETKV
jgi:hypothetical protein